MKAKKKPGLYPVAPKNAVTLKDLMGPEQLGSFTRPKVVVHDEDFLVIDKPPGLPTLSRKEGDISVVDFFPGCFPVHRLDTETSGLLLLASSSGAANFYVRQFTARKVVKKYFGWSEVRAEGYRRQEKWEDGVKKNPKGAAKVKIARPGEGDAAKTLVDLMPVPEGTFFFFIPITGRTHQLRIQAASRGLPLTGDPKYGDLKSGAQGSTLKPLGLHACYLEFTSKKGEQVIVSSFPIHWELKKVAVNQLYPLLKHQQRPVAQPKKAPVTAVKKRKVIRNARKNPAGTTKK